MLRSAIVKACRLPPAAALAPMGALAARCFAGGAYLDKGAVTERVLGVVKNFSKVDPQKARPCPPAAEPVAAPAAALRRHLVELGASLPWAPRARSKPTLCLWAY
jgi:hypothetical protein